MVYPNTFAYLMLCIWPFVTWQLWRRMDHASALVWTILGGYLLLPPLAEMDLPAIPSMNKVSIPNLAALAFSWFVLKDRVSFLPNAVIGKALMVLFVLSPFATVLSNTDTIAVGGRILQGTKIYDSLSDAAAQAIVLIPFFLARRYLAGPEAPRAIMTALVAGGLAYSLPMLVETRMSPQINIWVYGYFQHDFAQSMRAGGYRPFVFLPHGLWVAFFAYMAAMAAVFAFAEGPARMRPKQAAIAAYLLILLVLCKSAGPMIYAAISIPLILLAPPRLLVTTAAVIAVIVMTYPILRGAHLLPLDMITDTFATFAPDRAQSFDYRVQNEEKLLARAAERAWFGWGGYGRNLIYDPESGRLLTIPDGYWIIVMGAAGWIGYIAESGLMVLPLVLLAREMILRREASIPLVTGVLALILGINLVDLLPNATQIPFTWLMAGALLGQAERLARERDAARQTEHLAEVHPAHSAKTVI